MKWALLLQAVAEVEHSIAVKRRLSVTKPGCRDDYSSEEYAPKRKWSHDRLREGSPPPYIPSKKSLVDQSSHSDCIHQSKETRHLRHSTCLPVHEDCRELISRYRREELLRSIGIVRDPSQQKGDEKFTCKREVRGGNSSKDIQNFQITDRLVSSDLQHLASGGSHSRLVSSDLQHLASGGSHSHLVSSDLQHLASGGSHSQVAKHPSPIPGSSLHMLEGSASYKGTRTFITSRLGKLDMENKGLFDDDDVLDAGNSTTGDLLFSSKLQDTTNSINAQEKLNLIKRLSNKSASISSTYQEQHVEDVNSVEATLTSRKNQGHSRSVNSGVFSGTCPQSQPVEYTARSPARVSVQLEHQHSHDAARPGIVRSSCLGDSEDSAGAEGQDPQLLVKNVRGDSRFDADAKTTRQSAGGDVEKHEQEGERQGITFIVTLDGVDESQFRSEHAGEVQFGCEVDRSRQSAFEKVPAGHVGNTGSLSEKIECPVVSASVAIAPPMAPGLKQLHQEHEVLDLRPAVATPEHLMALQKVQSLKWAATDPFLLPSKSQPAFRCLKNHGADDAKLASLPTLGHCLVEHILDEDDGLSIHQQQQLERCKFWPACAAGGSCGYYHPTTHCKMFPKCRFGDKCLFIHPNCRFDSRCARPDCPYTHSSRRQPACMKSSIALHKSHIVFTPVPHKPNFLGPAYSGSQSTCRYFPNCQNGNCPFVHPKPCRFGLACKSLSCPFFHPNVPDKRMLKWQARGGKVEDIPLTASSNFKTAVLRGRSSTQASNSTTVSSTSR